MSMWPWPDPTNERIIKLERQLPEAMKAHARDQARIQAVEKAFEDHNIEGFLPEYRLREALDGEA